MTSPKKNPFWIILFSLGVGAYLASVFGDIFRTSEPIQKATYQIELLMVLLLLVVMALGVIGYGMATFG